MGFPYLSTSCGLADSTNPGATRTSEWHLYILHLTSALFVGIVGLCRLSYTGCCHCCLYKSCAGCVIHICLSGGEKSCYLLFIPPQNLPSRETGKDSPVLTWKKSKVGNRNQRGWFRGFLMVKLKSLKRGEPLPFEAIFALSLKKRDLLFSPRRCRTIKSLPQSIFLNATCLFWKASHQRAGKSCTAWLYNMNLLGPESRRKHILCDPVALSNATGQGWGTFSCFFPLGELILCSPVVLERCSVWLLLATVVGNCPASSPKWGCSQQKEEPLLLLPNTEPLPGTAVRCCFPGKTHHWESAPHWSFLVFFLKKTELGLALPGQRAVTVPSSLCSPPMERDSLSDSGLDSLGQAWQALRLLFVRKSFQLAPVCSTRLCVQRFSQRKALPSIASILCPFLWPQGFCSLPWAWAPLRLAWFRADTHPSKCHQPPACLCKGRGRSAA